MDALQSLFMLRFDGTKIKSLPNSLYRLAFVKPSGFLPSPWNDAVQWMRQSLKSTVQRYTVTGDRLRIEIRPDTAVPFAQEHLRLLVKALESNSRLGNPPSIISVVYPGEVPVDAGGLRRERFRHIFPDYAEQIKWDAEPILVYREERNCFMLERAMNREMYPPEIEFCRNTGKLMGALLCGFASFPNSRGDACKIGNIFPEHFYAGLLHAVLYLACRNPERRTHKEQEALCRILALNDKNGLIDGDGKLLFDLAFLRDDSNRPDHPKIRMSDEDLYKIWKLMNHYEDIENLMDEWFPSMAEFMRNAGFIREEFEACNAFPEGMLEAFRSVLDKEFSREEIQSTLIGYMFKQYHRQCEPLIYVAQGFRSLLKDFPLNTDFQTLVLSTFNKC